MKKVAPIINKVNLWDHLKQEYHRQFNAPLMASPGSREFVGDLLEHFTPEKLYAMWCFYLEDIDEHKFGVSVQMFGLPRRLNKYAAQVYSASDQTDRKHVSRETIIWDGDIYTCEYDHANNSYFIKFKIPRQDPPDTIRCWMCGGYFIRDVVKHKYIHGKTFDEWWNSPAMKAIINAMQRGVFKHHNILNKWALLTKEFGGGGRSEAPFEWQSGEVETEKRESRVPVEAATTAGKSQPTMSEQLNMGDKLDQNFVG